MTFEKKKESALPHAFCQSAGSKEFISDKDCAIILPQGASYKINRVDTGYFPLINFRCDGFSPDTFNVIKLQNSESYIRDFEKMHSLSLFGGNRAAIFSIFYDMINRLSIEEKSEYDILLPAIEHIGKNYSDSSLNNTTLSEICGISEVYFRKLFTVSRGISPRQYLIDVRIRRAKQLLTEGRKSVSEISENVGFSSVYHFCRAFKTKTGMTPSEYGKQNALRGI